MIAVSTATIRRVRRRDRVLFLEMSLSTSYLAFAVLCTLVLKEANDAVTEPYMVSDLSYFIKSCFTMPSRTSLSMCLRLRHTALGTLRLGIQR